MIWIAVSRMFLSLFLYQYCDRIHLSFPFILYFNQLLNAAVKVHCIFRLSKQRWTNRGHQSSGFSLTFQERLRNWMASYVTALYVSVLILGVGLYTRVIELPSTFMAAALVVRLQ